MRCVLFVLSCCWCCFVFVCYFVVWFLQRSFQLWCSKIMFVFHYVMFEHVVYVWMFETKANSACLQILLINFVWIVELIIIWLGLQQCFGPQKRNNTTTKHSNTTTKNNSNKHNNKTTQRKRNNNSQKHKHAKTTQTKQTTNTPNTNQKQQNTTSKHQHKQQQQNRHRTNNNDKHPTLK